MKPTIIVMVPVKNEAWILKRFLECTLLWADHIIIADQGSDDSSVEIAKSYPQVTVVENASPVFNEVERQKLLIEAARQIPGPRLLMALDADEILSANVLESPEWQSALQMPPGTRLELAKVELDESPDRYFLHSAWDKNSWPPFGFLDDGAPHEGEIIHTCRIPDPPDAPRLRLHEIVLLHYGPCNGPRNASKDRWYRCFERLTYPEKSVVEITRLYDWKERLGPQWNFRPVRHEWLQGYRKRGIDMSSIEVEPVFWWDWEILRLFKKHGTRPFRFLDLWSLDWEALRLQGIARGIQGLPEEPVKAPQDWSSRAVRAALFRSRRFRYRRYIQFVLKKWCRFLG